jgi:hypothetical protein
MDSGKWIQVNGFRLICLSFLDESLYIVVLLDGMKYSYPFKDLWRNPELLFLA